ncbi:MAG TPA: circadian clock KaiB family protein [Burkholderiaceae bacterium]|jgi:circadian clock protein KaiB
MTARPPASEPADGQQYRLYVTAGSPISSRAVVNARRFFEAQLPGRHRLSVLDIAEHIALARADQVVASPTLIRLLPLPQRRFIGDMSDTGRLIASLGLAPDPAMRSR